jgi:hypothetical protein
MFMVAVPLVSLRWLAERGAISVVAAMLAPDKVTVVAIAAPATKTWRRDGANIAEIIEFVE